MTPDEVTLTFPGRREFFQIAHLVLGGLAVRLDLTYEQLEDLQLALERVLSERHWNGELTVALQIEEGAIRTVVGPFPGGRLRLAVEETGGEHLDLRRLLGTVCDEISVEDRAGDEWIVLTKKVEP